MTFIETRLPDCVAYGFTADPQYQTQIVPMDNGKEQRNAQRTRARRKYSAQYQHFDPDDFAELLAVYHACLGAAHDFRMKDWTDFSVTLGALGTTPGANQTPVQLVKVYAFGAQSTTRTITKPVAGTVTVYQNGAPKAGSISTTTGLFTPTTNWTAGATLTASFEFDVPVRFAHDEFPASYAELNAISTPCELLEVFL